MGGGSPLEEDRADQHSSGGEAEAVKPPTAPRPQGHGVRQRRGRVSLPDAPSKIIPRPEPEGPEEQNQRGHRGRGDPLEIKVSSVYKGDEDVYTDMESRITKRESKNLFFKSMVFS